MKSTPALADYRAMFRRRRAVFLVPFMVLFGISVAAAIALPPVYEAAATIRIENHEVPGELVASTVTVGYIDEYLDTLGSRVMTPSRLETIAGELDPGDGGAGDGSTAALIARIRRQARREILYVNVGPEDQRGGEAVAVAFTVGYASRDPATARDVANALAELYIAESRRLRAERASRLADFLRERAGSLSDRVAGYEQQLAEFKERHGANLPEFAEHNLRLREATRDRIDRLGDTINGLNQQRIRLQAQLQRLEPRVANDVMTADPRQLPPAQQVERLRLEYLRMSAVYAPRHPDLLRLRNELRALDGETPLAARVLELVNAIEEDRARLSELRDGRGEDDPGVARLEQAAGRNRARLRTIGRGEDGGALPADNPAYIDVRSRLESVEADLAAEMEQRDALSRRLAEIDARLRSAPDVEKEYRALTREYESLLEEYQETRDKLRTAEAAESMEEVRMGGSRLVLAGAASRPLEPARPRRAGITVLGFLLAVAVAMGFTAVAEYLDRTVRGARGVMAVWSAPPIASIPVIVTRAERRARVRRLALGLWGGLLLIITGLAAFVVYGN